MPPLQTVGITTRIALLAGALAAGTNSIAWADPNHDPIDFGQQGSAAEADRTVEIELGDNYFEPGEIVVQEGETIRFVLHNTGELLHEFNIGTSDMHAAHQAEMMDMMQNGMITATATNMSMDHHGNIETPIHDDPNSVLVEPGAVGELVWTFSRAADLEIACNIPGHYQAGMYGGIFFDRQIGSAPFNDVSTPPRTTL